MTRAHPTQKAQPPPVGASRDAESPSALDISPELEDQLEQVLADAQRFGTSLRETVLRQHASDADRLIESAVASTQRLLGKWKLEILYSLTLTESARFSELRRRLGSISSRTLSNKLKELEEDGYLNRSVTTTRPLRVDYTPTAEGLRVAALTVPLIAYLNHHSHVDHKLPRDGAGPETHPDDAAPEPPSHAHSTTLTRGDPDATA